MAENTKKKPAAIDVPDMKGTKKKRLASPSSAKPSPTPSPKPSPKAKATPKASASRAVHFDDAMTTPNATPEDLSLIHI
eukprot:2402071-Heterocapsa_arctica.AAC.1